MTFNPKKSILFLCTGNSCRSQIAEALTNHHFGDRWEAFSAGTDPAGFVHPLALQVLSEIGVHHAGRSKSIQDLDKKDYDLVVTVCGEAEKQCPVWLGQGAKIHTPFLDPAAVDGSEAEKLDAFRTVRDGIQEKLSEMLQADNDQEGAA